MRPGVVKEWECHPKAESLILSVIEHCKRENQALEELEQQLLNVTSTRILDWLDHVVVKYSEEIENQLDETGFEVADVTSSYRVFYHPGAQLPKVVLAENPSSIGIGLAVDRIADFLMVRGISGWIEGAPLSGYRRCNISTDNGVTLWVVERRGTWTMEPTYPEGPYLEKYWEAFEKWQSRLRDLPDEDEAMDHTLQLAEELVLSVGKDLTAWIVLEVERCYWQSRNTAAQVQKNRQDRLGMGWANHDHHTFRSSRRQFPKLVRLFETLGFHCRERFYAGEQAGWGAQVMENSVCGLILFLDVDLDPHEVDIDFAHHAIPELKKLGTIGLWCELHGDSILKAGMHHLEAQFIFDKLRDDLAHMGVGMMDPFSNFSYLKQAFTAGEVWKVDPEHIERLLEERKITPDEAEKFRSYGAVGSHLENLQRQEGYKGFNKNNVSFIIKKTDPRSASQ